MLSCEITHTFLTVEYKAVVPVGVFLLGNKCKHFLVWFIISTIRHEMQWILVLNNLVTQHRNTQAAVDGQQCCRTAHLVTHSVCYLWRGTAAV